MRFLAAPEYRGLTGLVPDSRGSGQATLTRSRSRASSQRSGGPDIHTAPALAAEVCEVPGRPPHVYPHGDSGFPFIQWREAASSPLGRAMWRAAEMPVRRGLERGRRELNRTRVELGLRPLSTARRHQPCRLALCTFLQLEYLRRWPPHVVGPGAPAQRRASARRAAAQLAPSTAQDPEHGCCELPRGFRERPCACSRPNRRPPPRPLVPANALVTHSIMPCAEAGRLAAGHGTPVRASAAAPRCRVPCGRDMSENAARVDWAERRACAPRTSSAHGVVAARSAPRVRATPRAQ